MTGSRFSTKGTIMITLTLRCPYCASDLLIRYGVTAKVQQRYRCRACGRPHRENPGSNAYSAAEWDTLLRAYLASSKCPRMHELVIQLFLHRYNLDHQTF